MATCSGGSEHCPHISFAQPSRGKKSDRNQKYVDDSSLETRSTPSLYELGGLTVGGRFTSPQQWRRQARKMTQRSAVTGSIFLTVTTSLSSIKTRIPSLTPQIKL
ncbi:hypothetical protein YC2023_112235 [Brassica napus]